MNTPARQKQHNHEDANPISSMRMPVLEELASTIREKLDERGWFKMREPTVSSDEFRVIGKKLGTILSDGKIQILANPVSLATSDQPLALHNDEPHARYLAWYCEQQQAEHPVGTDLLDISDFRSSLGEDVVLTLSTIVISGSGRQHKDETAMVLVNGEARPNFVPWAKHILDTPEKQRALQAFRDYVVAKAERPDAITSVILGEGE
ncbi:MAG: hypothetical protein ACO3XO_06270, partial [Bdellovibrionota bacterium]